MSWLLPLNVTSTSCASNSAAVAPSVLTRGGSSTYTSPLLNVVNGVMPYRRIARLNNSRRETARLKVGLDDRHANDLRHTVGMPLREAGHREETILNVLWHKNNSVSGTTA